MDNNEVLSLLQSLIVIVNQENVVEYLNERAAVALGLPSPEGQPLQHLTNELFVNGSPVTVAAIEKTQRPLPVQVQRRGASFREAVLHCNRLSDGRLCLELVPSDGATASHLDHLTGLMDRSHMHGLIDQQLKQGTSGAVILMDIDRLKIINDFLGYAVGDQVIQALAGALREQMPADVLLARWSGHEFMALVPADQCDHLDSLSQRFLDIAHGLPLAKQLALPGGSVSMSIGHSRFGSECKHEPPQTITTWTKRDSDKRTTHIDPLGRVNAAVFEAKRLGRNRVVDADSLTRPSVYITGGELEAALDDERIVAAVQPIIELSTGRIIADESLARLVTPDGRVIPAGEFIEAASALHIANRIDHSIIRQTINYCVTSHFESPRAHFVNISSDFLRHPELIEDTIVAAMDACSCTHPDQAQDRKVKPLVIEITERELLEDTQEALTALSPLIDFGLRLAIDDFGSGYSSYRYLLDLPFHFLKIEGDLIRRIRENPKANRIVRHIQAMATDMGLTTVAEFVGDQETADELTEIGIDWAQGFHFGRPELMHPEHVKQVRAQYAADLARV